MLVSRYAGVLKTMQTWWWTSDSLKLANASHVWLPSMSVSKKRILISFLLTFSHKRNTSSLPVHNPEYLSMRTIFSSPESGDSSRFISQLEVDEIRQVRRKRKIYKLKYLELTRSYFDLQLDERKRHRISDSSFLDFDQKLESKSWRNSNWSSLLLYLTLPWGVLYQHLNGELKKTHIDVAKRERRKGKSDYAHKSKDYLELTG